MQIYNITRNSTLAYTGIPYRPWQHYRDYPEDVHKFDNRQNAEDMAIEFAKVFPGETIRVVHPETNKTYFSVTWNN